MQTFTDAYRFRHVLLALTSKQLKAQYRSMSLGFFWALLNPLVMITVLSVVFIWFFGQGAEHPARVVVALIPYNFFTYCLTGCATSITNNSSLVKKVWFPRQILPLSIIVTNIVHLGIQSVLVVAVLVAFPTPGHILGLQLLWLVPLLALLLGLCVGIGLLSAALTVVFRDTQYIIQSTLTVLFWMSPVLYDSGGRFAGPGRPGWVEPLYYLNPLAGLLDSFRRVLFWGASPTPLALGLATLGTLAFGALGIRVFFRHEPDFADYVK
ncbi:MAG: ABC transporter permease [Planctomycetes bacterium]|nr:ABC transporter permease [Planctomycetota bacterium]